MSKNIQCIFVILCLIYEINAYKFLVVSPLPGKSHAILGDALVDHLIDAGHEVTYITAFVPEKIPPRVTVVDVSHIFTLFPTDSLNLSAILDKTEGLDFFNIGSMMIEMSRSTIDSKNVRNLMADKNQKFDAVIAEWMFTEIYAGFAALFDCPLIWFSSVEPHWAILQLADEIPSPTYMPSMISDNVPPFTFKERVIELSVQIIGRLYQTFYISGFEHKLYDEFFVPVIRDRHSSAPSFETLRYHASLILSNSHLSMGIASKLPPNVICIGGYHIKPNLKPLPKELQQLMDNAKYGVIYFSMGSNLKSKELPDVIKQELLKVFGKLKQTVIWKFEEDFPNTPSNVHIVKWAPQQSILAHKNCILFVTHGGQLSTTETLHFGVPIIGIPVFGDQFINVARAVKKGYALKVDLSYTMASDIGKAIKTILEDPKYTTKVKELSLIYHDRPVPPAKELVHWAEHVVKTRGATHLRSPSFLVPWYQKLYLDLVFVLLIIFLALKYIFIYLKHTLRTKRKEKHN